LVNNFAQVPPISGMCVEKKTELFRQRKNRGGHFCVGGSKGRSFCKVFFFCFLLRHSFFMLLITIAEILYLQKKFFCFCFLLIHLCTIVIIIFIILVS